MSDKLVIQKREHGSAYTMVNVSLPTKEKIDQAAEATGYTRADIVAAMIDFGLAHLEIVEAK